MNCRRPFCSVPAVYILLEPFDYNAPQMNLKISLAALTVAVTWACSSTEVFESIERHFAPYSGADTPGAAVLVARNGKILFERCYGMADLEHGIPVNPGTNFRLASITKQFSALAVLQLIAEDRLSLQTTLGEVFEGFPSYGDAITLQHLMRHSSGLVDYESLIPSDATDQLRDRDVLDMMMKQDSTYFTPGSEYRYSNTAYVLLGLVVEEVTGIRFSIYLKRNVFDPAGMDSTVAFEEGLNEVPVRAYGYRLEDGHVAFADQSLTSALLGDGGIYSSLTDLLKWDRALANEILIDGTWLEKAWTPGILATGDTTNYGYGWRIDRLQGHRRIHHTGSTSGFRNVLQRYPDDGLLVVILTNRNDPDVASIADRIALRYLRESF